MSKPRDEEKDRRRDELFEDLNMGRLTPEAAERIAREEGLEPLQPIPGPNDFDPEEEAWWTLAMVVAWIVWRTMDRVRHQFDPFRQAAPYWAQQLVHDPETKEVISEEGWRLDYMGPASTLGLLLYEAWEICEIEPDTRETSVHKALADFRTKASAGRVQTIGVSLIDRRVAEIPPFEWCYLKIGEAKGRDEIRYEHDDSARYSLVRVCRKEVMKCWHAGKASKAARLDAYRRCLKWLGDEMLAHPDDPTLVKKEAARIAKQRFGMARDDFSHIWTEAAVKAGAPAWTRPGRRPTKRTDEINRKK